MPTRDGEPGSTHSDLSGNAGDVVQARDVAGGIHFHGAGHEPIPVPAQLPADVRGFVNRTADLERMEVVLGGDIEMTGSASVCVIAGTAGVGKTSLAVRWAHRNRHRFPGGQLYVNLRGYDPGEPVTANQALERFLGALGVPLRALPGDLESRAALYRSLLADRRVLVVLDNAATVGQVRPLLPGAGHCLALVTSRSRLSGLVTRDGAHRITLEVFDEPEAVELLRATTSGYRSGDQDADFTELARLCARLPLALRIAAERAAARPRMPMGDLIGDLRDESHLWDALSTEDDDEADAVRTVFAWSYRALPEDTARMFRLLGLHPGPDFSVHAAAALAAVSPTTAHHQLDTLVGAHLLGQTGRDRYQFHDLLRAYAGDQVRQLDAPEEQVSALRRVLIWYLHTSDSVVSFETDLSMRRIPLEPPHDDNAMQFSSSSDAVFWFRAEKANLLAAVQAAARTGLDWLAWQIPGVLRALYVHNNLLDDLFIAAKLGHAAAAKLNDPFGQGIMLESMAMVCRQSSRWSEAVDFGRAALVVYQASGDTYGEATALNLLGMVAIQSHHCAEARTYQESGVHRCREYGYDALLGRLVDNLAWASVEAGQWTQAAELSREALQIYRQTDNRHSELDALVHLALALLGVGEHEQAFASAEQALFIARELENAALEGHVLRSYGSAQLACGQIGEALTSHQRAATINRQLGDRSREAQAISGAGEAYKRLARFEEAASFHRQAAAIFRELGDSWQLAVELNQLADIRQELGAMEDATSLRREALPLLGGFDDPAALTLRTSIETALTEPSSPTG